MKSHEITLSPTRPPRSKHPSKRPCESQSTGPTRQNLSDWRYASIKDWKVAWKIPRRMVRVDDGRWDEELTDQQMIFPKTNRGGVLSQCSMRKNKERGRFQRPTSSWKHSAIGYFWTTSIPIFEVVEAPPRPRHQSSLQGSAKLVGLQPSSFAQKWKDWALPRSWRSLAYRDWEWSWDLSLLKPTCEDHASYIDDLVDTISGQKQANQKTERQIQWHYLGQDKTAIGLNMTHVESEHPVPPSLDHLAVSTCWDYVKHAKSASCR